MANLSTFPPPFDAAQRKKRGTVVVVSLLLTLVIAFVGVTVVSRLLH